MNEPAAAGHTAVSNPRLAVEAVLRTDVGLVRSENQDFGAFTSPREERESHPGGRLLIVADGMGGHRGGATASRLAVETVKAQFLDSETLDVGEALRDALTRANARIFSEAQANPDLRGMGTTASALVLKDREAWLAHVGDSRIYRVRAGVVEQLTEDHSLVASMVREGLLTPSEAETHPRRNVLQRSMGVGEQVDIDVRGPFDVQEGDLFVLCSDGLHGLVKAEELGEIAKLPLRQAADEYVRRALERGAPDNVTVIVGQAVRADQLGDETLTDGGSGATKPGKIEETLRDTVPTPAPVLGAESAPASTMESPPSKGATSAAVAPIPAKAPAPPPAQPGVHEEQLPGDRTLETAKAVTAIAVSDAPPVPPATATPASASNPAPTVTTPSSIQSATPATSTSADETKRVPASTPAPAARPVSNATQPALARKPVSRSWKWVLLMLFLAAGAASAWMYWSQQHAAGSRPATAPRSR